MTAQEPKQQGKLAIFAAMAANLGIAIAKFVGFLITGASAMLAEAIHSFADTSNQVLLLIGGQRARQAPDAEHQFGFARNSYFYSFIVALVIFLLGGVFSTVEGVNKITHGLENEVGVSDQTISVAILGVAILLETFSLVMAIREAKPHKEPGVSWFRFLHRTHEPSLMVLIMEDSGALIGLLLAMAGVVASWVTGNPFWDGIAATAIGVLLMLIAVFLIVEMKSLLIGESLSAEDFTELVTGMESVPGIERVIYCQTQYLGPTEVLVAAKIGISPVMTGKELAAAIDAAEAVVRQDGTKHYKIFIEPDIDHRQKG